MGNFCDECGQLHAFCLCDDNPESNISRDREERRRLEDYQDANGLSNDEMTRFVDNLDR